MTPSPITQSQWKSIGKVGLFILGSTVIAVGGVVLTNNTQVLNFLAKYPELVALGPILNWLAVIAQKFFTQGEEQAITTLPTDLQSSATQAVNDITTTATTAVSDIVSKATN